MVSSYIQYIINQISIWSILIPTTLGCLFFTKLPRRSKTILFLVMAACIPQLARAFLGRTPLLSILYNANILIEFFLLFLFFDNGFSSRRRNQIFYSSAILCLLAGVTSIGLFGIRGRFLTEWLCLNNLTYTTWVLLLIYDLYENDKLLMEIRTSLFCFITGLFFYCSCTILIFSLWHYIMANRDSYLNNLWIIHDVFNVFMYFAFSVGFIAEVRTTRVKINKTI